MKEAAARIKINKLLEAAGWRFFADASGPANRALISRFEKKIQADLARFSTSSPTTPWTSLYCGDLPD